MKEFKISKELFRHVKAYWHEFDANWAVKGIRIKDVEGFNKLYTIVEDMWNSIHENLSPQVALYDTVLGNMIDKEVVLEYDIENAYNDTFGEDEDDISTNDVMGYRALTMMHFIVNEVKMWSK